MFDRDAYERLLRLLGQVIEANDGQPAGPDDVDLNAEGLATKCLLHAATALHLAEGPVLPVFGGTPVDVSSISVVARAAMESMLLFQYLFGQQDSGLEEFRYDCWRLKDLRGRQGFPDPSAKLRAVLDQERKTIAVILRRIRSSSHFAALTRKQRKRLRQAAQHPKPGWAQIGLDTGLDDLSSTAMYSQLCSHAHSGATSVSQFRQNPTAEEQLAMAQGTLGHSVIVLACMISAYCARYPKSQAVLDADPEGLRLVNMWRQVGAGGLSSSP